MSFAAKYVAELLQTYMLNEEYKNISMNILDFIAKCFIGLGLWAYYTKVLV